MLNNSNASCSFLGFLVLVGSAAVARIVTDPKSISTGVDINYSYNETIGENESNTNQTGEDTVRYISAPGCPQSVEGFPWVHYNRKCHLAGIQGPCAPGMKLFIQPELNNYTGICNCSCFDDVFSSKLSYTSDKMYCFNSTERRHYSLFAPRQTCFKLLSQGPCKNGEWFVMDAVEKESSCVPRECPASSSETDGFTLTFFHNETKRCQTVGDRCGEGGRNGVFQLSSDDWIPQCTSSRHLAAVYGIDENTCQEGMRFSSVLETCVKSSIRSASVG